MDRVTHLILLRLGLVVVIRGRRWRHLFVTEDFLFFF